MRHLICPRFCRYYKPDRPEEEGCGGLAWLADRAGLDPAVANLSPDPSTPLFGLAADDRRLLRVCQTCPYRPEGCDFRDPSVPRDQCAPCGGLRVVAGLLAAGRDLEL